MEILNGWLIIYLCSYVRIEFTVSILNEYGYAMRLLNIHFAMSTKSTFRSQLFAHRSQTHAYMYLYLQQQ